LWPNCGLVISVWHLGNGLALLHHKSSHWSQRHDKIQDNAKLWETALLQITKNMFSLYKMQYLYTKCNKQAQ